MSGGDDKQPLIYGNEVLFMKTITEIVEGTYIATISESDNVIFNVTSEDGFYFDVEIDAYGVSSLVHGDNAIELVKRLGIDVDKVADEIQTWHNNQN